MSSFCCTLWAKFCGFYGVKISNILKQHCNLAQLVGRWPLNLSTRVRNPGAAFLMKFGHFPYVIYHLFCTFWGPPQFATVVEIDGALCQNTA